MKCPELGIAIARVAWTHGKQLIGEYQMDSAGGRYRLFHHSIMRADWTDDFYPNDLEFIDYSPPKPLEERLDDWLNGIRMTERDILKGKGST